MQASLAIVPRRHWGVVRGYAALHLLAMYLGVVAGLPGLPAHRYLPHGARHTLRLLGLWAPHPAAMLPVLVAMLLVGWVWKSRRIAWNVNKQVLPHSQPTLLSRFCCDAAGWQLLQPAVLHRVAYGVTWL